MYKHQNKDNLMMLATPGKVPYILSCYRAVLPIESISHHEQMVQFFVVS